MAAYVIFVRDSISDPAGMDDYAAAAGKARGDHKIERLAFYGPCEALEGPPVDGVVIVKFEDMAAAKAWYDSDAYQEAAKIRQRSADYRVILTEGV